MTRWRCGGFALEWHDRPLIMGIVNVTPDSFSDGYPDADQAVAHAQRLVADGADLIDVGGESTRPGSEGVSEAEELRRVLPVVERLVGELGVPVSVDTQKPEVARRAIAAGASVINHVSGTLDYAAMLEVLAGNAAGYVVMHMNDRPRVMQEAPVYADVVAEVGGCLAEVGQACQAAGIAGERLVFDLGIGFGKKLAHNLALLRGSAALAERLGRPLLMGLSRKSWLNHLLGGDLARPAELDAYTALASVLLPFPAVGIHRVHNVKWLKNALKVQEALVSSKEQ